MCLETELSEMSNGAATSVTRASPEARCLRMPRRVSSARAIRVLSRSMALIFTQKDECVKPLAGYHPCGIPMKPVALIVGAGSGLSASLARLLAREGFRVAVAARNAEKLSALAKEIDGLALVCDATVPSQVEAIFATVEKKWA